jgi:uncharacterized protein YjiS (DUF1127 family)
MHMTSAESFDFRAERPLTDGSIPSWIRQQLDARKRRQAIARDCDYLKKLDRHLLDDIGVEITASGEVVCKL